MNGVEAGGSYEYDGLKFSGLSLSGIRTAISMPEYHLSFDVAQGYPHTLRMKKFFISHGHLDHAAGIPYIVSQKAMHNEAPPVFYMPAGLVDPLKEMMRIWERIEDHTYQLRFEPVTPDSRIDLGPGTFVRPFQTVHRVESLGYTLFSAVKKLKPEYLGLAGAEIARLKREGRQDMEMIIETPLVSFTGDTQIEFLDSAEWVRKSRVLICEATYLDDRKSVEHARKWGHTHIDELIPRLDEIESEKILLIHASSRYSDREALRLLQERIPAKHRERVELFPGR